jgi:hypothetical protein
MYVCINMVFVIKLIHTQSSYFSKFYSMGSSVKTVHISNKSSSTTKQQPKSPARSSTYKKSSTKPQTSASSSPAVPVIVRKLSAADYNKKKQSVQTAGASGGGAVSKSNARKACSRADIKTVQVQMDSQASSVSVSADKQAKSAAGKASGGEKRKLEKRHECETLNATATATVTKHSSGTGKAGIDESKTSSSDSSNTAGGGGEAEATATDAAAGGADSAGKDSAVDSFTQEELKAYTSALSLYHKENEDVDGSSKIAFSDLFEITPHPYSTLFPQKLKDNMSNQGALRKIKNEFFADIKTKCQSAGGHRHTKTLKRMTNSDQSSSIGSMYTSKNIKSHSRHVNWHSTDSLGENLRDEGAASQAKMDNATDSFKYSDDLSMIQLDDLDTIKI